MLGKLQFGSAIIVLVCLATWSGVDSASAVSVEVARKCEEMSGKAFPPREVGNPAAGLAKGTAQSKRDYFNKCLANGGKMDDDTQGKK